MIVAALQPGYLPWLGFFDLFKRSDLFVIEDSLKYTKQDWRNRNRIRTSSGTAYLTVPVEGAAPSMPINEVRIDSGQTWARRQWNLLEANYRRAPYWKAYSPFLHDGLFRPWERLIDLDLWFTDFFLREFAIKKSYILLSSLDVAFGPDKTQSLIDLTRVVGATGFIEGQSGKAFIDLEKFEAAGFEIAFQEYRCVEYRQQFDPFVSHLSALDLLLNEGPGGARFI